MGFDAGDIKATLRVDRSPFQQGLDAAIRDGRKFADAKYQAKLDADTTAIQAQIARVKARLEDLARQRTNPTIDADITAATAKVAQVQARLEELRAKTTTPKVDADIAAAEAQLARLRARLDELGARRANPTVDADTTAAEAKLELLRLRLAELDGRRAQVDVDVDTSRAAGHINALATSIVALGGPIGGAVIGLAALGAGAVVGAAGLGAVALGVGGIVAALKAQDAAAKATGASAAESAARQLAATNSVLNAQDSLRSAVQGVAAAERNSAEQVRSALEGETRAEETLQAAQESALRAQRNLTDAREAAARSIEDLQNRVKDDALAQREATLRLAEAQDKLNTTLADPSATARQREEAKLSFDQARQHLNEINLAYQRSQVDAAAAAKAGVDGSKQVVSAQDQVVASQRTVHDAQVALGDANRRVTQAQVTGAEQVTRAQESVVHAQRALAQAQAQAAAAADTQSAAQRKLAAALANLSPAGRAFVAFVDELKPKLHELALTSQQGFLPGFQSGIEALTPLFPQINANVGTLSRSTGQFFATIGNGLAQPYWSGFFNTISTASTTLFPRFAQSVLTGGQAVGTLTTDLLPLAPKALDTADAFSHLVENLSPFIAQAGGPLLSSLQGVLGDLTPLGPLLRDLAPIAADVSDTFGHALTGALQAADGAAQILAPPLHVLAEVLQALPGPVDAAVAAMLIFGVKSGQAREGISGLTQVIKTLPATFSSAASQAEGFGLKAGAAAAGTSLLKGAGSAALGIFGGPWGLALGAGVTLLGLLGQSSQEAAQRQHDLAQSAGAVADAIAKANGQITQSVRATAALELEHRNLLGPAQQVGISLTQLTDAATGNVDALRAVNKQLDAGIAAAYRYRDVRTLFGLQQLKDDVNGYVGALNDQVAGQQRVTDATRGTTTATQDLSAALERQQNLLLSSLNADLAKQGALAQVTQAQKGYNETLKANAADSDQSQAAALRLNQSIVTYLGDVQRAATEQAAANGVQDTARAGYDALNRAAIDLAATYQGRLPDALAKVIAGMTESDLKAAGAKVSVDNLGHAVLTLPDGKTLKFDVKAPDANVVWTRFYTDLQKAAAAQPLHFAASIDPAAGTATIGAAHGRAAGGLIPGAGNTDSFPAMLMPGEYVIRKAAVSALGVDYLHRLNNLPGYATGGLVQRYATGGPVAGFATGGATPAAAAGAGFTAAGADTLTAAVDRLGGAFTTVDEAQQHVTDTTNTLLTAGLAPFRDTLTTTLFPTLEHFAALTGTTGVQAVLALAAQLPPLAAGHALTATQIGVSWAQTTLATQTMVTDAEAAFNTEAGALSGLVAHHTTTATQISAGWAATTTSTQVMVTNTQSAFGVLHAALTGVNRAVDATASWFSDRMGALRAAAAGPVRFVITGPFNAGIIAAWNALDAQFSLGRHVPPIVPGFATGGPVPGAGDKDTIPALLTPGEFVISKPVVAKWGLDNIHRAHLAARYGEAGLEGMFQGDLNPDGFTEAHRYAAGGPVAEAIGRGLAFAKAQAGKPYIWGGVGPAGFDCSGLLSAVTNTLRGEYPYRRLGVARSQPWPGFQPGLGGAWSTGFNTAHTVGTLSGTNVESAQTPIVFPGRHGADDAQFSGHAFLPDIGGVFTPGGGGGGSFDPGPIVDAAFAHAYDVIAGAVARFAGNVVGSDGASIAGLAADGVKAFAVRQLAAVATGPAATGAGGGGVARWRGVVNQALAMISQPAGLADTTLRRMNQESGGSPTSVNRSDVNWRLGHPSVGLMQVIRGTYEAYKDPRRDVGPYAYGVSEDPLGNILASMHYAIGRYGSLPAAYNRPGGYDAGGLLPPGATVAVNSTGRPEAVLTERQWQTLISMARPDTKPGGGTTTSSAPVVVNIYPRQDQSEASIGATVVRHLEFLGRL